MTEQAPEIPEPTLRSGRPTKVPKSKFSIFVVGSICLATLLVCFSMYLYQRSGAAQLDLSRPGYEAVRAKVQRDTLDVYPSNGPLDETSLAEFRRLYEQADKSLQEDTGSFSPDELSNKALGIKKD